MSCSHSSSCPLFAQFAMEPALAIWKKHFCDGEYTNCARYQMGLKGEVVPITLLPNGKMILSGLLQDQVGSIVHKLPPNFGLVQQRSAGEWAALLVAFKAHA